MRALVLTGAGLNAEAETAAAWRLAGAEVTLLPVAEFLAHPLDAYRAITLPGGFSYGDELGSGVGLANALRFRRGPSGETGLAKLRHFVAGGGYLLGICNGFQVLARLGLVPDTCGDGAVEVSLAPNAVPHFVNRWVRLEADSNSPFFAGISEIELPVRHGEGRVVFRDAATAARAASHVALRYLDAAGLPTEKYPFNPNGSPEGVAGLTDRTGRILGLMPHPEAAIYPELHPDHPGRRARGEPQGPLGLALFAHVVAASAP